MVTAVTVNPPSISKSFGAASINVGASTSLSFSISNPNGSSSLSGVGFSDTLPAGLVVATPNGSTGSCGGGTITATAGSGSISLSGATLAGSDVVYVCGQCHGNQRRHQGQHHERGCIQ